MIKINFLGDSITEGHGASSLNKGFVTLVSKALNIETRNYGIGGTRIAKQKTPSEKAKHDLYFIPRVKEMDKDANLMFVFGGTNDFGHGDAPFGKVSDYRDDTFYGALHVLIDELCKYFDKNKVVFILPLHREEENSPYGDGSKTIPGESLDRYRDAIREVCNLHNMKILDITEEFGPAGTDLFSDSVHPSDKGYQRLAELVGNYIKKELKL